MLVKPWPVAGRSWAPVKPSWVHAEQAGRPGPLGSVRTGARFREEEADRYRGRAAPSGRARRTRGSERPCGDRACGDRGGRAGPGREWGRNSSGSASPCLLNPYLFPLSLSSQSLSISAHARAEGVTAREKSRAEAISRPFPARRPWVPSLCRAWLLPGMATASG